MKSSNFKKILVLFCVITIIFFALFSSKNSFSLNNVNITTVTNLQEFSDKYYIYFDLKSFINNGIQSSNGSSDYSASSIEKYDYLKVAFAIQGLLNRDYKPVLFYNYPAEGYDSTSDNFWLDELENENDDVFKDRTKLIIDDFNDIITFSRNVRAVKGIILWDTLVPATANVASTIAGVENRVPLRYDTNSESCYNKLYVNGALSGNYPSSLKSLVGKFVNNDYLPNASLSGWSTTPSTGTSKIDAYKWAYTHYMALTSPEIIAYSRDSWACDDGACFMDFEAPREMNPGEEAEVSVYLINNAANDSTGWTKSGKYRVAAKSGSNEFAITSATYGFESGSNVNSARLYLPEETNNNPLKPGDRIKLTFKIKAPTSVGEHYIHFGFVHDGVAWYNGEFKAKINVGCSDKVCFSDYEIPENMAVDSVRDAKITVYNNSSETWTYNDLYRLAAAYGGTNAFTVTEATYGFEQGNSTSGVRLYLPNDVSVQPGQSITLTFKIKAPSTTGNKDLNLQMVHDGHAWLSGVFKKTIKVSETGNTNVNKRILKPTKDVFYKNGFYNLGLNSSDYLIMKKAFFYDLSPDNSIAPIDDRKQTIGSDYNMLNDILLAQHNKAVNANGENSIFTVSGFVPWSIKYTTSSDSNSSMDPVASEWKMVNLASSYGGVTDADAQGPVGLTNASVYSKVSLKSSYTQNNDKEDIKNGRVVKEVYDSNTIYYTFLMGDYDSGAWTSALLKSRFLYNNQTDKYPLAWVLDSGLTARVPHVFNWLYKNQRSNDYFVAGDNGAGYFNLLASNEKGYSASTYTDKWKTINSTYNNKFDLDIIGFLLGSGYNFDSNTTVKKAYAELFNVLVGFHDNTSTSGQYTLTSGKKVPFLKTINWNSSGSSVGERIYNSLKNTNEQFVFVRTVQITRSGAYKAIEDIQTLAAQDTSFNKTIKIVDPYTLAYLYMNHPTNYKGCYTNGSTYSWETGTSISSGKTYVSGVTSSSECSALKSKITKPTLSTVSYKYNGDRIIPEISGFNSNIMIKSGSLNKTDVGSYSITIELKDKNKYSWSDGSTDNLSLTWDIQEETLTKPTINGTSSFNYDGQTHSISLSDFDSDLMTQTGTISESNPGTYTVTISLKDNKNYTWADGTTTAVVLTWSINDGKTKLTKPTLSTSSFTYNANSVTPIINDFDSNTMTKTGDLTKTNAGSYSITISLQDTTNYEWSDGSTSNIVLTWNINKVVVTKPTLGNSTYTYSGNAITPTINGFDSLTMGKAGDLVKTTAGNYTITITLNDTTNYEWNGGTSSDLSLNWKIEKIKLTKPSFNGTSEFTYDGDAHSVTLKDFDSATMSSTGLLSATNAGTNNVTISLDDTDNYSWSDGIISDVVLTWKINKIVLTKPTLQTSTYTYSGNNITPVINNFDSTTMTKIGDLTKKVVGNYTITISLKDTTNYEWNGGTTSNLSLTWKIEKKKLTKPSFNGTSEFDFDGSSHSVSLKNYDSTTMTQTGSLTQTNPGTYTVTISLNDTDNYSWSDGSITDVVLTWKINKVVIKLTKPTLSTSTYTYSGNSVTPTITGFDSTTMNKTGDLTKTNAGNFSITISLKDTENYTWSDESIGNITLNWKIEKKKLTKPSFNGTSEFTYDGDVHSVTLNNFDSATMTQAGSLSGTNASTNTVTISLKDTDNYSWSDGSVANVLLTWKINKIVLTKPTLQNSTYTYSGNDVTPVINTFDSDVMTKSGDLTKKLVGNYTINISLKDTTNYEWNGGTTNALSLTWKIEKKKLTKPSFNGTSEFDFDGSSHSVSLKNYDSSTMTQTGSLTQTNPGNYNVTISLNDTDNYAWSDGSITDVVLTWKINKVVIKLTKPTLSTSTYTYSGNAVTPVISGFDSATMNKTGDLTKTNAGNYTITVSLKDTENYTWSDGSTGNISLTWKINKIVVTKPTLSSNTYTFTGNNITPTVSGFADTTMTKSGDLTKKLVGNYTITIALKDTTNYEWNGGTTSALSLTWKIEKKKLTKPSFNGTSEFTYDGESHSVTLKDYSDTTMTKTGLMSATNASSNNVTVSLNDTDNYSWSDGTITDVVLTWKINKIVVTKPTLQTSTYIYSGNNITPVINTFDSTIMTKTGDLTKKVVGNYTITVALKDTTNYEWNGGSTSNLSLTWKIEKKKLTKPSFNGTSEFDFDGSSHSVSLKNFDSSTMTQTGSLTQTNPGNYNVTVALSDTDNYAWSDGSVANVVLTWKINKVVIKLTKPTLSTSTYTYSGNAVTPVISGFDSDTMAKSGDLTKTNAGNYTITVSLKDTDNYSWSDGSIGNITLNWTIEKNKLTKPSFNGTSEFTYDGNAHSVTLKDYSDTTMTKTGLMSATNASSNNVTVSLNNTDNYSWSDGTISDVVLTWKINKIVVTKPTLQTSTYTYSGNNITPVINTFDSDVMTKSGDLTKKLVGNYTITVALKDTANYEWNGGTTSALSLTWKIEKKKLTKPSFNGTSEFVFDGEAHSVSLKNYDSTTMTQTGSLTQTNPGTYNVTIALKDIDNYSWSDGSVANVVLTWKINKVVIKLTKPTLSTSTYTYSGNAVTPNVSGFDSDTMVKSGDLTKTNAGNYTITVSLKDTDNYSWSDGSVANVVLTWKINKITLTKPSLSTSTYTYNGNNITPTISGFVDTTMNKTGDLTKNLVGNYKITVALKDTTNYEWNGGTTSALSLTWKIEKKKLTKPSFNGTSEFTYDGESHNVTLKDYDSTTMMQSGSLSGTNASTNNVTISLKDTDNYSWSDGSITNVLLTWKINKIVVTKPTLQTITYTYSGNDVTPVINTFDSDVMTKSGDLTKKLVGNYTITISLKDTTNYEWNGGTTSDLSLSWKIEKKKLTKPTFNGTSEFDFDGDAHSVSLKNYDSSTMTQTGSLTQTNPGTYNVTVALKDTDNYAWSDGSVSNIVLTWKINKVVIKLTKPTLSTSTYTYNGNSVTPVINGFDSDTMNKTGDLSKTNAGNYSITIGLKDKDNYSWSDNTDSNITLTWTINKIVLTKPTLETSTYIYNGNNITPTVNGFVDTTMNKTGDLTKNLVGNYTITVALKDTTNYEWNGGTTSDLSLSWKIEKKKLTKPSFDGVSEFTYDGEVHSVTLKNYDSSTMTRTGLLSNTNASKNSISISLNDTDNYSWSDGSITDIILTWKINKIVLTKPSLQTSTYTYSGNNITPVISNFDSKTMNKTGNVTKMVVGNYTITVSLKDTTNYEWNDETNVALSLPWKIEKKKLSRPSFNGTSEFDFDGEAHSVSLKNYDSTTMTSSGSQTETNPGSYKVTISLNDTDNYSWSDGSITNVVLTWKINTVKVKITKPTLDNSTYTYSGNSVTPVINGFDSETMTKSGDLSKTNAGTYSIVISLKDKDNYIWSDNTNSNITLTWKIEKKNLVKPSFNTASIFDYDGASHSVSLKNFDSATMMQTGSLSATNAGTYSITIALKDSSNYSWSDGSTSNVVLTWKINKIVVSKPTLPTNTFTYSGVEVEPVINGFSSNTMSKTGDLSKTNVGNYTISISLKDTINYEWSSGTNSALVFTWKIEKKKLIKPSFNGTSEFDYDGEAHSVTLNNYSSSTMTQTGSLSEINSGNYTITISLKDINNYEWADNTNSNITLNWKVNKISVNKPSVLTNTFTYTGKEISLGINGYSDSTMNLSGNNKATEIGNYSVVIKLKDKNNYIWSDNKNDDILFNWSINKIVVSKPTLSNSTFTYDGKVHTISLNNYDSSKTIISGTYSKAPAGTYNFSVELKDSVHSTWTDGTNSKINFTWKINKANINPSVSISNYYENETPSTPKVSGNLGSSSILFEYASKGSNNYGKTQPKTSGTYILRVTINESDNYNGKVITKEFKVLKKSTPSKASNDSTLSKLVPSFGSLTPSFSSSNKSYSMDVDFTNTSSVSFDVLTNNKNAKVSSNTCSVPNSTSTKSIDCRIVVTAEDSSKSEYIITLNNTSFESKPINDNIFITSLNTNTTGNLTPGFREDIYEYNLSIDFTEYNKITFDIKTSSSDVVVNGKECILPTETNAKTATCNITISKGSLNTIYKVNVINTYTPCDLKINSSVYEINQDNKTIVVNDKDSLETIVSNINNSCGQIKFDKDKIIITDGINSEEYMLQRVESKSSSFLSYIIYAIVGLLVLGIIFVIIKKHKKESV